MTSVSILKRYKGDIKRGFIASFVFIAANIVFDTTCWSLPVAAKGIILDIGDNTNAPYVSYLEVNDASLGAMPVTYAFHYESYTNKNGSKVSGQDLFDIVIRDTNNPEYRLSFTDNQGLWTSFTIGAFSSSVDPYANPGNVWTYYIMG